MIWLNFLRDLKSTISRLISVIIITMIAVMVYTALMGIPYNVDLITGGYFDAQNAADYWITGVNLDREDCRTLSQITGVTGVQPRVVYDAEEQGNSAVVVSLYAVPDYSINTPLLIEGSLPCRRPGNGDQRCVCQGPWSVRREIFTTLTVTGTDLDLRLQISGLIKERGVREAMSMPPHLRRSWTAMPLPM